MIRSVLAAVLLTAVASPALAQDAEPQDVLANYGADPWSFAFGAATDNRSKDASKSDGNPFVWGEAVWETSDGFFYAGPAFETIDSSTGSNLETDIGLGIRPQFAGFDLDLNATHKWQIDADPDTDDDAWEFTADVSRSIGPAGARLRLQHSPDGTGSTEAWTWYEARVSWDFTDKLSGSTAIGRREQDNSIDYTGWNAGFTYALTQTLEADLRWHATDANEPGEQYRDGLVFGISAAF